ncbi:MAG: hypothetical protein UR39_C0005G0013 [Candidatus Woesebacteria bacterium GW2011_GWA1_33_30]|uniref:Endonuclease/exonuclease/phosphatase domain-containing protein n=1 Tax=Candidatus Woesebacteria bacterium GW2011_GWA2_33_28 TaxID=1618561 RepID=A0A0G0C7K1_9BACT|nr:MAG: hypothetical protein UR38_C0005G0013 [Candidatus Woesebacteria bacterium GW2011_GWA2_33_28]KKP48131.1 MAG: hypothetical protein UR39_C0005G0013 [Candidatus Woesebacteria bacterium GW2011_GWA1_33_30]KKP49373.1 MAG: hypothetical protein UR40_C0006G0013 [Microgenomates group bacterium GW2011_GWC1_33_32]KKP52099.1 MAG: hypothetical protein UR44_C0004G0013 [Candidatus Woesebacteria bacterium GW2011_GWB1_33_38]KKP57574.1 MAG: hypothetical protein UR48_C0014G0003 [Microgenomates group bacteriu
MKIIFLNCWQGKVWDNLSTFLKKQEKDTDTFCFVEVSPKLHSKFSDLLIGFNGVYESEKLKGLDGIEYGQSVFVRTGFDIQESKKISLYKNLSNDIGFMQVVDIQINDKSLLIANIHGMSNPGDKLDTLFRLKQSKIIIKHFIQKLKRPIIITGDFNLLPDTKSIKLFEKADYRNLIKEFKIKSTRNKIAWQHFKNDPNFVKQYYADYCFVSKDIKVKNFTVPDIEISDHLPLILEFEIHPHTN